MTWEHFLGQYGLGAAGLALAAGLLLGGARRNARLREAEAGRDAALRSLADSETRFGLAMQASDEGLFDWHLATDEVYYSPRWKAMLGYGVDELEHRFEVWERLVHPTDRERAWAMMREYMAGEREAFDLEFRMLHRDGHWVDIHSRACLVRDHAGRPARVVGTHVDVSERKRAQAQLRAHERQLRGLLETSSIGIGILSERRITEVNRAFCRMSGYARDELMGQNTRLLFGSAAEYERLGDALYTPEALSDHGYAEAEARLRRRDGSTFDALIRVSPIDDVGRGVAYAATVLDISAVKQAERRVVLERNRAQQYLDIAGVMLLALDRDGRVVMVNAKGCEILGLPESQILGRDWFATFLPMETVGPVRELFHGLMHGTADPSTAEHVEGDILGARGERRTIAWHNGVVTGEDGRPAGVLSSGRDITEQRKVEAALAQSQTRLKEAEFLAGIGNFAWNLATGEITWSEGMYALLGYRPGERITLNMVNQSVYHEDDLPLINTWLEKGLTSDATLLQAQEFRARRKDRSVLHGQCIARIERENGKPVKVFGTFQDITGRVAAERRVEDERRFLEHVMDGIDDPILVVDRDFRVVRMNRTARLAGEAAGKHDGVLTCHSLCHGSERPCDEPGLTCPVTAVFNSGEPTKVVHDHTSASGATRTYEVAASPLRDDAGEIVGVIEVSRDITNQLSLMSALKEREESYAHLAHHDPLTGLPNRLLFADRLSQAMRAAHRRGLQAAVLFIDLDRFKHINDSFDHSYGDRVLVAVAERLVSAIREDDTVARMGGDEFTVLLRDIRRDDDAGVIARKLLALFKQPFEVQGHRVFLGASIGISVYPRDGDSVETLVRNADAAMYRAKEQGRDTFHYYTEDLTAQAFKRVLLESSLHHAIERAELVLFYQPQFDLLDGSLRGMEALVRWHHPDMGLVPPGRFIPLAEESGLILPMGQWILAEACRQMVSWRGRGLVPDDALISVNLSAKQFERSDLIVDVQNVLAETAMPRGILELEVTESVMMRDADQSARTLGALRDLGVKVAIDDFGTGYSSLNYLKRLPLTKLKIDQSFVADIPGDDNAEAIVRAVIGLATSLSLELLAEGIETEAQRDFLAGHGCRVGQGYLFARPLAVADFEALMRDRTR